MPKRIISLPVIEKQDSIITMTVNHGHVVIIDAFNEHLAQHHWYVLEIRRRFYVRRMTRMINGSKPRAIYLHREVSLAAPGDLVDHINGNPLDNRAKNLRTCNACQNQWNRSAPMTNTSGFKGVSFNKEYSKYYSAITVNRKTIFLGVFDRPDEAARAYDAASIELHGEFARLNFPE